MRVIAKLNNLRISPRKVRLVGDMIRGKNVGKAKSVLSFSVKKGALPMKKLLDSALANAKNNFKLDEKDLFVSLIKVDEGRTLRRWRPRARGRACRIEKKTSNITLELNIFEAEKTVVKKAKKIKEAKREKEIVKKKQPAKKPRGKKEAKKAGIKK